jgi:tetratricopeptide (TPR) repeat protein
VIQGGLVPDPDFFISHADADLPWAEWIAAELKAAGYGVIVKAWDFLPGENRLTKLDEALISSKHTLCVLSEAYLDSEAATQTAAYYQNLQGKERALIPVQIAACDVPPLLGPIVAIDLADVDDEDEARNRLLAGVADRAERVVARGKFPRSRAAGVRFPTTSTEVLELRGHRADPHFIGRDEVLSALHRDLRSGRPAAAIQVITGLGGQGKTGLVVEYAHRYAAAYDLIWWIRAEDPATMRGDYVELAAELGLPAEKDDLAIAALRRELRRRRDWLLIVDNAEDPDELFPLLPDKHSGHVLVTSRLREWPHAETRQLDVLSTEAAAEYLESRGRIADRDVALEIAEALGCLPLALVQAASVIAVGMPAADYLDLLHQRSPKLFAEGHTPDRDMTIATTWQVSVDRLAHRSTAALAMFRLAAFLGADAIPLTRLTATEHMPPELAEALADKLQRSGASAALGEYSLAETTEGLLSIHRLVQAVTRAELGDEAPYWAEIALAAIAAAFPDNEQDPKTWQVCEDLLAHALASAGHAVEAHVDPIATVRLLDRVARYLLARGRLDSANAILKQALTAAEHLAAEDTAYLSCRSTYGQLLCAQGDFPAARAVQEEIYRTRAQILADDPDTLRAGRDLVQTLHFQGHRLQAAQLHDRLIEAFTATLGPEDPETITTQAFQASILGDAGQYARARVIGEQVVEARTRVLGEEHLDTLLAKVNLVTVLGHLGELKQARVLAEQVIEARIRVLGEEHPDTLGAKVNLVTVLGYLGEFRQARVLAEQTVEALIRVLGEEHPDTLAAKANLASVLGETGELKRARAIEEQVIETRSRVLGEEHPQTLLAKGNLASILGGMGELKQARVLAEQVVEARARVLGEEHPETLVAKANLAMALASVRELQHARTLAEQVVEAQTRILGEEHPETLETRTYLATMLLDLGEPAQAGVTAQQVVEARTRLLGEAHSKTLAAMAVLATILASQGDVEGALSLLTDGLDIALRVFGQRHTVTTEAAWHLVENCGPHQAAMQRRLTIQYLSWLTRAQPDHLSANQKRIKRNLAGTGSASTRTSQARKKRK